MSRESVEIKGRRLLAEGRPIVQHAELGSVVAICRGDSGDVWQLHYRRGGWGCDCPVRGRCSHLVALMLVVSPVRALVLKDQP